jgi:hypothetical protein
MTHESILTTGQAKGIFQFPPTGQDHFKREGEFDGKRDISSRPPEDIGFPFEDPCDRIIAPHMDLTVVEEEIISDFGETVKSLLIRIRDGFVAHITTRHHQCLERSIEQKVVKR